MVAIVVFAIMIGLLIYNVPIAICTGLAALVGFGVGGYPLMLMVQRMFTGLDSFTFIAIPLFIMTGRFMALGGTTRDLINVSKVLVGFMKGGLAYINVVASMLFAGITGSAAADTASIGAILIPTMVDKGYDRDFSVAVTATSSTIGIMIPPSIPMVVYGVAASASIGQLFLGGIVPGVLVGLVLIGVSAFYAKKRNYPRDEKVTAKEGLILLFKGIPAMLTIVIILGGIIGGFFTATEAAGVAALYSFILGAFYYREIRLRDMPKIIVEVAVVTGQTTLMIATASALAWLFARQNVPAAIGGFLTGLTDNRFLLLLLINLWLLFVGTWLDLSPAVIIFTPILLPIAVACGVDPVHFGVIMVVNLGIGLFTPPVGVCLFVACGIAKCSITSVVRAFLPFFASMVLVLLLITYVPGLVMWLPSLLKT
jgi:C4-dicarboxylate transporter DctM subunit